MEAAFVFYGVPNTVLCNIVFHWSTHLWCLLHEVLVACGACCMWCLCMWCLLHVVLVHVVLVHMVLVACGACCMWYLLHDVLAE